MVVGKRGLGRRKIEIKKIEKKPSLQVTFTKRRAGLFNKASELSILCGAQVAILVQSPAGKVYSCGHPSVDALIHPFLTADAPPPEMDPSWQHRLIAARSAYGEAVMALEMEKRRRTTRESWWSEEPELHELEDYLEALLVLTDNVWRRADEMDNVPLHHQEISASTSYDGAGDLVDNYDIFDAAFN